MIWAVLGGLFLFALFFGYMSYKTWRFFHVFMFFCVFVGATFFCILAAMTMKTQVNWKKSVQTLTQQRDQTVQQNDDLLFGKTSDPDLSVDTLSNLNHEIHRQLENRGRVWRDCEVTNFGENAIELDIQPSGGSAIPVGSRIVAFKEGIVEEISGEFKVPVSYLGEFLVTDSSDDRVAISSTIALDPDRDSQQIAEINDRTGTWALYEKMPLDAHDAFEGLEVEQITTRMPQDALGFSDEDEYQQLMAQFHFDGQTVEDIRSEVDDEGQLSSIMGLSGRDPNLPAREWQRLKFLKSHRIDPNGELVPGADFSPPFDTTGRALTNDLLQVDPTTGEAYPTEFEPDDEAVFDLETANELTSGSDPIAEVQERLFFRELMDFDFSIRELQRQHLAIRSKTEAEIRNRSDIDTSIANVQKQIAMHNQELGALNQDLDNHRKEAELARQYRVELQQDWDELKSKIRDLYFANQHYESQLASLHRQLTEQIDQRTQEATETAGGQ